MLARALEQGWARQGAVGTPGYPWGQGLRYRFCDRPRCLSWKRLVCVSRDS